MNKNEVRIPTVGHPEGVTIVFSEKKEPTQIIEIEKIDTGNESCFPTVGHDGPGESVALKHIFHPGHK